MFSLHEQLLKLQEDETEIASDFSFDGIDSTIAKRTLNGLTDKLVVNGQNINDTATFHTLMCFARDLPTIDPKLVARGLDMLVTAFENEIKQVSIVLSTPGQDPTQHAESLDRYAFLFQWIVERGESVASQSRAASGAEKTKGRKRRPTVAGGSGNTGAAGSGGSTVAEIVPGWKDKVLDMYILLQQLLQLPLGRIWNSVPERDTFIGVFTRIAHKVMENLAYTKDGEFMGALFTSLCLVLQNYNGLYGLVTMITQNLQHYEHLSESMAVLVQLAYEKHEGAQLADEVLRDIAGKAFNSMHDKAGPKNAARFLIKFSQLAPRALLRQMGLLIRHLDSEAHIMRSAMVDVIGHLTLHLASQDEQTDIVKNQINEYFDIIEQRFQDAHYLVRAKVMQVCQFVCSGPAKFPKRRPRLLALVIGRLEDKATNVRKHAIRALTVLLESHPFSLDGAELGIEQLEVSLEKITDELAQMAKATPTQLQPKTSEVSAKKLPKDIDSDVEDDEEEEEEEGEGADAEGAAAGQADKGREFDNAGLSPEMAAKAMHLQFQQRYYRDALYFVYQLKRPSPFSSSSSDPQTRARSWKPWTFLSRPSASASTARKRASAACRTSSGRHPQPRTAHQPLSTRLPRATHRRKPGACAASTGTPNRGFPWPSAAAPSLSWACWPRPTAPLLPTTLTCICALDWATTGTRTWQLPNTHCWHDRGRDRRYHFGHPRARAALWNHQITAGSFRASSRACVVGQIYVHFISLLRAKSATPADPAAARQVPSHPGEHLNCTRRHHRVLQQSDWRERAVPLWPAARCRHEGQEDHADGVDALDLNGMVKVKGQLGEMAKCLEDKDPRVADMARLFFSELSSKDNAVYNNLPDIISSLSMGTGAVNEDSFGRIMKFLFEFIKEKDRQTENVVEKLCQRFRNTTDPRQCRDIAYCMALLPYKSERSVRRLLDGLSSYQDKLSEDAVYKYFVEIVAKSRSQSAQKQEIKA
ncbi:non-SMC mitotic condensation complex subunit 1-domain-containing protein [Kickxella alabastrina]|uniref:non-SMC mitotic condensation complex subunit 1-domain-containing protein n=1 Tax=Kickxella alabastrina TaxID=61397 RepID=UPI0022206B5D|nr:non-SMC mitotic condensation complex subunit 1-domain-containing protein [Kickxella alabastrina]KAI7831988.1 non-SMC mitotic condensation complex subunit 1-domain-containing protein [Kickxella alabastrina]